MAGVPPALPDTIGVAPACRVRSPLLACAREGALQRFGPDILERLKAGPVPMSEPWGEWELTEEVGQLDGRECCCARLLSQLCLHALCLLPGCPLMRPSCSLHPPATHRT